jgi:hypothetical protein
MKKKIISRNYFIAACMLLLLSNCKKVGDIKQPPPVDNVIVDAMYPVIQSYFDGTQSYVFKYEYDKDNHLTNYSRGNTLICNIGTNQVDLTFNQYAQALVHVSTTSYVYTLAGLPNTAVNIYNTAPTQVSYTYYEKDVTNGTTTSRPGGVAQFFNNKDGLPYKMLLGTDWNYNLTYDGNKNLTSVEFVRLSGPRTNLVSDRWSFTSFDNKHSPFSAVKGYWAISFPQGYTWDYALAFCKNNPKQITTERYDDTKKAFVPYQVDDYSYVYNDKGYPTQITISTTYYSGATTHYSRNYSYTYK